MFAAKEFIEWKRQWKSRLERQQESKEASQKLMQRNNPAIIPRNYKVEEALQAAVKQGDFSVMKRLLDVLSCPYAHSPKQVEYASLPPKTNRSYKTFCGT